MVAEHLAMFYVRGEIALDEPLLARFFEAASPEGLARITSFSGLVATQEGSELPTDVVERFKLLWEHLETDVWPRRQDSRAMLQAFGDWFSCSAFAFEWRVKHLRFVMETTGVGSHLYSTMKTLKTEVSDHPIDVLNTLYAIASSPSLNLYEVLDFRDILDALKADTTLEVTTGVNRLVNYVMSLGVIDEFKPYYRV